MNSGMAITEGYTIKDARILSVSYPIIVLEGACGSQRIMGFKSLNDLLEELVVKREGKEQVDLYECIYSEYRKMYIDYDNDKDPNDPVDPKTLALDLACIVGEELGVHPDTLTVDVYQSHRPNKRSFHLVVQGYAFHYEVCKKMMKRMLNFYTPVDPIPYGSSTQMRLYGSYKGKEGCGTKIHVEDNGLEWMKRLEASFIGDIKNCIKVHYIPPPPRELNLECDEGEVSDKVMSLSASFYEDYGKWVNCGILIKTLLGDEGEGLWHKFSAQSDKYDQRECESKWNSFIDESGLDKDVLDSWCGANKVDPRKKRLCRPLPEVSEPEEVPGKDIDSLIRKWTDETVYESYYDEQIKAKCTKVSRLTEFINDWSSAIYCVIGDDAQVVWVGRRWRAGKLVWVVSKQGTPIPKLFKCRWEGEMRSLVSVINMNIKEFTIAKGMTFDPTTTELIVDEQVNTFTGLAVKPADTVSEDEVSLPLDHIRYVFADDNEEYYQWIIHWYAWVVQKRRKAKVAMGLYSEGQQTTGKSLFNEHFAKYLLGHQYFAQYSDVKRLTDRFNIDQLDNLFVVLDEAIFSGDKRDADKLKSIITQEDLRYEIKGATTFMGPNHANYVILTNNMNPVYIEKTDRRYAFFHCNETWCGNDKEYFQALSDFFKDPVSAGKLLRYLMDIDLTGWNAQATIPDTEMRRNVMDISASPLDSWMDEVKEGRIKGWVSSRDAYDNFILFCMEGGYPHKYTTIKAFTMYVKKSYEHKIRKVDGKTERGFFF